MLNSMSETTLANSRAQRAACWIKGPVPSTPGG